MDDLKNSILQARGGDTRAFDDVVRRFQGVAFRYAYAILRDRDAALDATQEALVQAYRGLPSLHEPAAFAGWFRMIVSRCARRLYRSRREDIVPLDAIAETPSDAPSAYELLERRELAERVAAEIRRLPERERRVTDLFYLGAHSQREIAEILDLPVTTVNNRLHSSRARLRSALSDMAGPKPVTRRQKEKAMQLTYEATRRTLLKGDVEVTVRKVTRADIPAMRRLDEEIAAGLDFANAQRIPGSESGAGGPWSEDDWMAAHFDMYEAAGNITLLVEDESGKLVAFAELWSASEPEPFGRSLDVECNDYLWEYHGLGIETMLLEEAEKVARQAGIPALDLGTNTSSGCYPALRRFGMTVFYEYDAVTCRCRIADEHCPPFRVLPLERADRSGLVRVSHWAPTDFDFEPEPGRPGVHEFVVAGHRVIADFYRLWEQGHTCPIACELFTPPQALTSPELMNGILRSCAAIAGKEGAETIPLPCPSDIAADESLLSVVQREFQFAWMRKKLS